MSHFLRIKKTPFNHFTEPHKYSNPKNASFKFAKDKSSILFIKKNYSYLIEIPANANLRKELASSNKSSRLSFPVSIFATTINKR